MTHRRTPSSAVVWNVYVSDERGWTCPVQKSTDIATCVRNAPILAGRKAPAITLIAKTTRQALGRLVADAVLQRFALTEDEQAPTVVLQATPAAAAGNLTLQGQVLDNLSGVASAQYRIDDGELQPLVLGANGAFTLTTTLAIDGSADGTHTVTFIARDAAGNTSGELSRSFVLDTQAPVLTLTSLAEGAALVGGSRLAGAAGSSTGFANSLYERRYA